MMFMKLNIMSMRKKLKELFSSDILVYDHIDSSQMKFISSFYDFNLSQTELNACFIVKNNNKIVVLIKSIVQLTNAITSNYTKIF